MKKTLIALAALAATGAFAQSSVTISGNIDLAFIEDPVLADYQFKKKLPVVSSYAFTGFDKYGFAFAKGSAMRDDFDKYLVEQGPEKIKAIIDKWVK